MVQSFRSRSVKHYRFDVSLKPPTQREEYCAQGDCMAIELVRNKDSPLLKVYKGQHWAVRLQQAARRSWSWRKTTATTTLTPLSSPDSILGGGKSLRWRLINQRRRSPRTLDLKAVSRIVFQWAEDNGDGRDRLAIIGQDGEIDLVLQGGIYYSTEVVKYGIEHANLTLAIEGDMDARNAHRDFSKGAGVVSAYRSRGAKKGRNIVGVSTALASGLFYGNALMLAYVSGTMTLVTNFAMLMAGLVVLGGLLTGAVAGLLVGAAVGAVVGLSKKSKYKKMSSKSAPTKMFEKLRCLGNLYRRCHDGLELVPRSAPCPEEPFEWETTQRVQRPRLEQPPPSYRRNISHISLDRW